jgi:hypothetical protein
MESALIASRTLLAALEAGRFDAAGLARFEQDFRAYFDPPMRYLELCATIMRNRHFREFWLRATQRGFERAQSDRDFGRVAGAAFGGLDLRPQAAMTQVWTRIAAYLAESAAEMLGGGLLGLASRRGGALGDLSAWERGWRASVADDPAWHFSWLADVGKAAVRSLPSLAARESPRVRGPLAPAT